MLNWKTTLGGAGAILAALASIATMVSKGQVDGTMLVTDFGILAAGVTGLFAKDSNVTGGTPNYPATTV